MVALNENLVYGTLKTYDIKVLILTLCAKLETMLIDPNEKNIYEILITSTRWGK